MVIIQNYTENPVALAFIPEEKKNIISEAKEDNNIMGKFKAYVFAMHTGCHRQRYTELIQLGKR